MRQTDQIRYIKRENIDIRRWDQCIDDAQNGLIYAYSFYLDNMAKNWDALILNDYEAVMPLPWNKKWGIKYLYQPPLTQQLGIFGSLVMDEKILDSFIREAKSKFRFAEIFTNNKNQIPGSEKRTNYILKLDSDYEAIYGSYKADLLENLKKSKKTILLYAHSDTCEEAVLLFIQHYGKRIPHVTKNDYGHFVKLCHDAIEKKMLIIRKVTTQSNELLAISLFLKDGRRIYNIMPTTLPKGRDLRANHFLLDELIKEFSGNDIILDFEGSEIPGIGWFYQRFGAINEFYYFLRYNDLPWPLNVIK